MLSNCFLFYRRKLARERQQKVLAEFASKQKVFMEKTMSNNPGILRLALDNIGWSQFGLHTRFTQRIIYLT